MAIYNIYKELGETPLECLERARLKFDLSPDISMTYVGRLDPAAEGLMIILTEDDIKNKNNYMGLDKIYEVEFIVGVKTDTGDLLGVVQEVNDGFIDLTLEDAQNYFNNLSGERDQRFHSFSSKVIDGKPLWMHARDGLILNITHKVNIKRIDVVSVSQISTQDILTQVKKITDNVRGDFRQQQILDSWNKIEVLNCNFMLVKINTHVSSGTYMRVLGEELGELIKKPVCVYSINRKEIIF